MAYTFNNKYIDYSEVKTGKKVKCPTCQAGHFKTDCDDVKKAHIFYCDNCGEILQFNTGIDLRNI